jgi:23S rRNA-/tRNA-specific pseudouridylate synthase
MLFCKNKKYNKFITDLFREKTIIKKYIARVDTISPIETESWSIENKLIDYHFKHFKRAKSSAKGKEAITHFRLLSQSAGTALIECSPKTGRLHQIRVHLAEQKTPIQGDFHYNKKYKENDFKLCAYHLSFHHPRTNKFLTFEIPASFS